MDPVVDHVPGNDQPQVRDVQHAVVVGVPVPDVHHQQVVTLDREPVVRDSDRGDRRRRDQPRVQLVPQQPPCCHVAVHLRDRRGCGDDTGTKSLGQHPSGEPVVPVAVCDEDVRHVPALAGDPVAEHARLIRRHPGVREDRVIGPVNQRAGHGLSLIHISEPTRPY